MEKRIPSLSAPVVTELKTSAEQNNPGDVVDKQSILVLLWKPGAVPPLRQTGCYNTKGNALTSSVSTQGAFHQAAFTATLQINL